MSERDDVPRLRPVEAACPTCGSVSWGLKGSMTRPLVAACYPAGHERELEQF